MISNSFDKVTNIMFGHKDDGVFHLSPAMIEPLLH